MFTVVVRQKEIIQRVLVSFISGVYKVLPHYTIVLTRSTTLALMLSFSVIVQKLFEPTINEFLAFVPCNILCVFLTSFPSLLYYSSLFMPPKYHFVYKHCLPGHDCITGCLVRLGISSGR